MSKLTFHKKPMPIMAEHRPIYKITQIILVLYLASRGNKSSLIRLHLFSWVLKNEKRREILMDSMMQYRVLFGVWGVDPAVNISLQYAVAEGLIEMKGLSYQLTQRGKEYGSKVDGSLAFRDDYLFLESLGSKITESMVQKIVKEWT